MADCLFRSFSLAPRNRFLRLRFNARKAAFRKHSETGSSLRPFTPLHGLPVSGSPRQDHRSWPLSLRSPLPIQLSSPFGHPAPNPASFPSRGCSQPVTRCSRLVQLPFASPAAAAPPRDFHPSGSASLAEGDAPGCRTDKEVYLNGSPDLSSLPTGLLLHSPADHRSESASLRLASLFRVPLKSEAKRS